MSAVVRHIKARKDSSRSITKAAAAAGGGGAAALMYADIACRGSPYLGLMLSFFYSGLRASTSAIDKNQSHLMNMHDPPAGAKAHNEALAQPFLASRGEACCCCCCMQMLRPQYISQDVFGNRRRHSKPYLHQTAGRATAVYTNAL